MPLSGSEQIACLQLGVYKACDPGILAAYSRVSVLSVPGAAADCPTNVDAHNEISATLYGTPQVFIPANCKYIPQTYNFATASYYITPAADCPNSADAWCGDLTFTAGPVGTPAVGMLINDATTAAGTYLLAPDGAGGWIVSISQTVGSSGSPVSGGFGNQINITPYHMILYGQDKHTTVLSSSNTGASGTNVLLGWDAAIYNMATASTHCNYNTTVIDNNGYCTIDFVSNPSFTPHGLYNWPSDSISIHTGLTIDPLGNFSNQVQGLNVTADGAGGDMTYLNCGPTLFDSSVGAMNCMRLIPSASGATAQANGLLILNGWNPSGGSQTGYSSAQNVGILIKDFSDGSNANDTQGAIQIFRYGAKASGATVSASIAIDDKFATAGSTFTKPDFSIDAEYQTGGNMVFIQQGTSADSGDIIHVNAGLAGGTFSGLFLEFDINSGIVAKIDAAGDESLAGTLAALTAGVFGGPALVATSITAPLLQTIQTADQANYTATQWSADTHGAQLDLLKSRATTPGQHAAVVAGDSLGSTFAWGDDGTTYPLVGKTFFGATGTISTGVIPGEWTLSIQNSSGALVNPIVANANTGQISTWSNELVDSSGDLYSAPLSTAGIVTNTSGGELQSVHAVGGATTPANFSATKYLSVNIAGTTYYIPADTATW